MSEGLEFSLMFKKIQCALTRYDIKVQESDFVNGLRRFIEDNENTVFDEFDTMSR